jgi:hypothetical protein
MARKRSSFVPRLVLGAGFGGVVPACVALGLQACSSSPPLGVAAVAYCCFEASTGDADASDAKSDAIENDGATDALMDAPPNDANASDGADE